MRTLITEAHAGLLHALHGVNPPTIPLEPAPEDFAAVADYVSGITGAFALAMRLVAREVNSNSNARIDPDRVVHAIHDAVSDELGGPIEQAEADAEAAFLDAAE